MRTTLITVRLHMVSAGGVTSGELDENTMKLRTDPRGNPHLPGTTVAGSLRSHFRRHDFLGGVFGDEPPSRANGQRTEVRNASKVQVLGTVHRQAGERRVRRRTAVDPERGAADNHALRGVEQLPPGTEFDVMLRWDDPDANELEAFFEALASWKPRLGRGVSHGSGHCRVTGCGRKDYDLTTEGGLLAWIQNTDLDSYPAPVPQETSPESPHDALEHEYEIVDGVHIGAGEEPTSEGARDGAGGEGAAEPAKANKQVDIARVLREQHGDSSRFVIPGSSLKGVLRSRAEYICRVVGADACVARDCGECRPCKLFGYSQRKRAFRSPVVVHDAVIRDARCEYRQHVALDRFTGGAAPGLLYTDEVIVSGRFTLHVEIPDKLDEEESNKRLLEAVAADLHDGLVGIGARTTSGQGTVRLTRPEKRPDIANLAEEIAA